MHRVMILTEDQTAASPASNQKGITSPTLVHPPLSCSPGHRILFGSNVRHYVLCVVYVGIAPFAITSLSPWAHFAHGCDLFGCSTARVTHLLLFIHSHLSYLDVTISCFLPLLQCFTLVVVIVCLFPQRLVMLAAANYR